MGGAGFPLKGHSEVALGGKFVSTRRNMMSLFDDLQISTSSPSPMGYLHTVAALAVDCPALAVDCPASSVVNEYHWLVGGIICG